MDTDPNAPGFYFCHVHQAALMAHKSVLFWDGDNWCSDGSPSRTIQAIQRRFWCRLSGGQIYLSRGRLH